MENTSLTAENYALELDLKRSSLDRFKRHLSITNSYIEFGGKKLLFSEIDAMRYGILQMYVNGIRTNRIFEIRLKDSVGQAMRITFSSEFGINKRKIEDTYNLIIDSLWFAITGKLVNKYYDELMKGNSVQIANCELTPHGIGFKFGLFVKKPYFFTWDKLLMVADKGFLIIRSSERKRICKRIPLMRTWNAVVLHALLSWLWKDGRAYNLSKQQKTHQI
jgi:hypothetical protein